MFTSLMRKRLVPLVGLAIVAISGCDSSIISSTTEAVPKKGENPSVQNPWRAVKLSRTFKGDSNPIKAIAISPNGRILATGSANGSLKLWDLNTGEHLKTFKVSSVDAIALSPDGQILASGGDSKGSIQLWQMISDTSIRTLTGHSYSVKSVAFSPDGHTFASGSWDRTVKLWNSSTGKLLHTLTNNASVNTVAFGPGKEIACGNSDGTVKFWRTDGKVLGTFPATNYSVYAIAFSPDKQRFVTGSADGKVKIWDLKTAALLNDLVAHQDSVTSLAINPDGQILASGSADKTIKLWNLQTGYLLQTLPAKRVLALTISPDGRTLVSSGIDGTLRVWKIKVEHKG